MAEKVTKEKIIEAIDYQRKALLEKEDDIVREKTFQYEGLPQVQKYAVIITGIRRCGKSTLQRQYVKTIPHTLYLNFEDPRLYGFTLADFELLDEIIAERKAKHLFFDEIQIIDGWERYVQQKLDEHFYVFVTGSNASMLSRELGTKLTGRHLNRELLPFSYTEYLVYQKQLRPRKKIEAGADSYADYITTGGFPEFIELGRVEILYHLLDDILFRDIATRYGVRDMRALKQLALYLLSNTGNLVTANRLTQAMGLKSTTTITDYFSYLEQSYLVSFVQKFDWSYKVRAVNPKKVYSVDTGLTAAISITSGKDTGHLLETAVYWQLHRTYKNIWYDSDKTGECDFVCAQGESPEVAVQVCQKLTAENRQREIDGLCNTIQKYDLKEAYIVTQAQDDAFMFEGKKISVIPAYKLSEMTEKVLATLRR